MIRKWEVRDELETRRIIFKHEGSSSCFPGLELTLKLAQTIEEADLFRLARSSNLRPLASFS
jgi:hypothetical protein